MTPKIKEIIVGIMGREGGYVDHPSDKGGPTMYGVTEKTARIYGYQGRMQDLPRAVAEQIFFELYYKAPKYNLVESLSPKIAEELVDSAVLHGQQRASTWLQVSLSRLNMQGKLYPDLVEDGAIGSVTIAALSDYLQARRKLDGERVLLVALNCLQGQFMMIDAIDHRQQNEDFLFGWLAHRISV